MGKRPYIYLLSLILLLTLVFHENKPVFAVVCDGNLNSCDNTDLEAKKNCLEEKVRSCTNLKGSLTNDINRFDTQIYLIETQISETEQNIAKTQSEIETLGSRIVNLDSALNHLTKLLLEKIVEGYKKRSLSIFDFVINSQNANDFFTGVKYLKSAQNSNQRLVVQVQQTKTNFEEQKNLREEKVKKLDDLKNLLSSQNEELINQKAAKEKLLVATQNSETVYQSLLEKARAELAGFSAFARAAGGGLTSFGNGSNGWYFTQRDPAWGNITLPGSSSSLALAGCAVTSVAMVCKSYGQGISPATIAGNPNNFFYGDLYNDAFSCAGKSTSWIGTSQNDVKLYVTSNTPVILRLVAPSVSGLHFIVAYGWDDGKQDFKIHDPYYGPDKYFTDQYSWSQVTTGIVIK